MFSLCFYCLVDNHYKMWVIVWSASDCLICGQRWSFNTLENIRKQFLVNRILLKALATFPDPARLYLGLEQVHLVSFTSSNMLDSCCLTSRFQGLARNFLFCSLLGNILLESRSKDVTHAHFFFVPQPHICIWPHSLNFSHSVPILPLKLCSFFSSCLGTGKRKFVR